MKSKLKQSAILTLLLIAVLPTRLMAGASVPIGFAHSGAWYDPSHNGEGYLLEILTAELAVRNHRHRGVRE